MFLRKCQSFRDRKCPDLKGTRTPNLRIYAECSNHLRCKDQKLAVPWHVSTLLFLIGGSQAPSNIFKINTIYVLMCCNIHTYIQRTCPHIIYIYSAKYVHVIDMRALIVPWYCVWKMMLWRNGNKIRAQYNFLFAKMMAVLQTVNASRFLDWPPFSPKIILILSIVVLGISYWQKLA